jgi:hypothetical protein
MRRPLILIVLAGLLAVPVADVRSAHAAPTIKQLQKKIRKLDRSRDFWMDRAGKLRRSRNVWKEHAISEERYADAADRKITVLNGQINERDNQIASLTQGIQTRDGQIASLTAQRNQAQSGIAGAIMTLPDTYEALAANIFRPLQARLYPCSAFYTSSGYWSWEFYGGVSCGADGEWSD